MFFFFNDTATTEIYTLSLHDALPIWVRHQAARAQHFSQGAELSHDVGRRDDDVGVEPPVLDLLDVLDAHEIGARRFRLFRLFALGDHQHADLLAGAVGQAHSAAHDLVGVFGIDAEPHGHVHGLVD